jgi:Zn-dependent protease
MGHSLAARKFGINTHSITLYPFGGIARVAAKHLSPWEEIVISMAGPLVNLGIVLISAPFLYFDFPPVVYLILLNLVMGIFNLFPAFPMDGGRVLRATLSHFSGDDIWATTWAIRVSLVIVWSLVALSVYFLLPMLILVSIVLHVMLLQEVRRLERRKVLQSIPF